MRTMGEVIASRRKELGMTQADLALKMSVTDKAVSKWERDLSCPDINSLSKLAENLDIPVDELLNAKKRDSPVSKVDEVVSNILKAVPLAMGVAVVVLSILNELEVTAALSLLGIGLACLSIEALHDNKKHA